MSDKNYFVCYIGWMPHYQGRHEDISGGGITEPDDANEVCNFLGCSDGHVYGHVESIHRSKKDPERTTDCEIAIEKIGGEIFCAGSDEEHVGGVTVIWTAPSRGVGGRRVVGWYENARVYRKRQHFTPPSEQHECDGVNNYRIVAKATDAFLVPVGQPSLPISSFSPGFPGRTPWWYAQVTADEKYDLANMKYDTANMKYDTANKKHDTAKGEYDAAKGEYDAAKGEYDAAKDGYDKAKDGYDKAKKRCKKVALFLDKLDNFIKDGRNRRRFRLS